MSVLLSAIEPRDRPRGVCVQPQERRIVYVEIILVPCYLRRCVDRAVDDIVRALNFPEIRVDLIGRRRPDGTELERDFQVRH